MRLDRPPPAGAAARPGKILLDEKTIAARLDQLAGEIRRDFGGGPLAVIGAMCGAFIFMSELVRRLPLELEIGFLRAQSYGDGTAPAGPVRIIESLEVSVANKPVLLVDDILDSGLTLRALKEYLAARRPARLATAVLLEKSRPRLADIQPDYVGFRLEDRFVVGYGLDFAGRFRHLPYVAELVWDGG